MLLEQPLTFLLALGFFEAFRRLDIPPEEIMFGPGPDEVDFYATITKGDRGCNIWVGPLPTLPPERSLKDAWTSACDAWNQGSGLECAQVYAAWLAVVDTVGLIAILKKEGLLPVRSTQALVVSPSYRPAEA